MPKRTAKPKLPKHTKASIKMVLPLMALTIATGLVLVVSSFAAAVYPSSYMNNLYSQAFGRGIDSGSVSTWQSYFRSNGCSGTTLANAAKVIYSGSEFGNKSYNAGEVVNRVYGGALQRKPDANGYNYWVGKLNSGSSRSAIATAIINGGASEINRIAASACAAPVAPTQPTPTPTPTPTKPTPTPAKPKPTPAKPQPSTPTATPAPADTTPPGKPGGFKAEVDEESTVVGLSWDGASDSDGVATYKLERSTDNTNWTVLDDTITETSYDDRTVVFSTTYQYRLRAIDGSGNASETVAAEAKTGEFNANATATDATAIASEDNVVIASLPAGAVPEDANCTVDLDSDSLTELKATIGTKTQRLAGPYLVSCKDSNGDVVAGFSEPVVVTVAPPSAVTKGNTKFKIYI